MRQRLDVKVGGTFAPKLAVSAEGNVTGLLLKGTQIPPGGMVYIQQSR
jgi:hypothetical protein